MSPDEGTGAATVPVNTAAKAPAHSSADKVAKAPATRHKPSSAQVASKASHESSASDEDEDLAPGSAVAPPSSSSSAPSETADTSAGDETEDDNAPPAPAQPVHKRLASVNPSSPSSSGHPYSIQIDAMMDYQGAQQMEQKLRAKGFQPYMVPTQLGGKTWYRLRVGHYTTPADAQAAEAKLHQEFNDTSSGH